MERNQNPQNTPERKSDTHREKHIVPHSLRGDENLTQLCPFAITLLSLSLCLLATKHFRLPSLLRSSTISRAPPDDVCITLLVLQGGFDAVGFLIRVLEECGGGTWGRS